MTTAKTWNSYAEYMKSPEWAAIREAVHARDVKTCQMCGKQKQSGQPKWACHHWRYPVDWRIDSADNVVLLCGSCHAITHEYDDILETKDLPHNKFKTWPLFLVHHYFIEMGAQKSRALMTLGQVIAGNSLPVKKLKNGRCAVGKANIQGDFKTIKSYSEVLEYVD